MRANKSSSRNQVRTFSLSGNSYLITSLLPDIRLKDEAKPEDILNIGLQSNVVFIMQVQVLLVQGRDLIFQLIRIAVILDDVIRPCKAFSR